MTIIAFDRLFAAVLAFLLAFGIASTSAQEKDVEALQRLSRIVEAWRQSPHADINAGAFTHWNDEEAREIPGTCAVCHSGYGFNNYVTGDLAAVGIISTPVPLGNLVDCATCHGESAANLMSVPFPSGVSFDRFGSSATCAVCHQGRAAGKTVENAVAGLDVDTVYEALTFINVHYAPSAGTLLGSVTGIGYEYQGKNYKGRFTHVPDFDQCSDCHRPHSLATVPFDTCTACHKDAAEFSAIRMSQTDFDGDGDVSEGIGGPIREMHARLYTAIQTYARNVAEKPVIYADQFPYFFIDSDGDGAVGDGEAAFPNRYMSWTPRLLKAAYNYQYIAKDKAAYTHNPNYALQILFDTLEDLSVSVEVDMAGLTRP